MRECIVCAKTTDLITPGPFGGIPMCKACQDQERIVKSAWRSLGATKNEQLVQCPFCGYPYDMCEGFRFVPGFTQTSICPQCGKKFNVDVSVLRLYSTRRSLDEMPEGWTPEENAEAAKMVSPEVKRLCNVLREAHCPVWIPNDKNALESAEWLVAHGVTVQEPPKET